MALVENAKQKGFSTPQSVANPFLMKMIHNETLDEDIIWSYTEKMITDSKSMDSEKSWEALLTNLQILDLLISRNTNLHVLQGLICTIFQTFLYLKANSIKEDIKLLTILNYQDKDICNAAETQQRAYLQIKTSLLRIYSLDASSVKSQFKELTLNYDSNSDFYKLLVQFSFQSTEIAFALSYSFIKLSLSTKTAYKLVFLILATHYSVFTGNIKSELFDKIAKDGKQMFIKSDNLIYKLASSHLYALDRVCELKRYNVKPLDTLIEAFSKFETDKVQKKIPEKVSSFSELLQPLVNMNLSDNISTLLDSKRLDDLLSSKSFVKQFGIIIRNLDIDNSSGTQTLFKIISFLTSNPERHELVIIFLDPVLIKLKDLKCTSANTEMIHSNLEKLANFMIGINLTKKLTNLSRLFFHFGNIALMFEPEKSVIFWASFLRCDRYLCSSMSINETTLKRLYYISSDQISKANFEVAIAVQLLLLNTALSDGNVFDYESFLQHDYHTSVKLITNCLVHKSQCSKILFEHIQNESLITALVLSVVKLLESMNLGDQKEILISQLIIVQKESLNDTGLFLYFLSRISMIINFPISFKNSSLSFNLDSAVIDYENLVIPHLYILQSYSNARYSPQFLLKCCDMVKVWIKKIDCKHTEYEFEIIKCIYFALQYNNLHNICLEITRAYFNKRVGLLSKNNHTLLISFIIDSLLFLEKFMECKDFIDKNKELCHTDKIRTYEEMNLSISILQLLTKTDDLNVISKCQQIHLMLSSNEMFSISKQGDKYKAVELLIMHSKFCLVLGLYPTSGHLNSVTNINKSMSIMQSIFKNFLLQTPRTPSLNINFKSLLKIRFSLEMLYCYNSIIEQFSIVGLGKEFNHYLKELDMFIKVQPSINLQYYYNLKLLEFSTRQDAVGTASQYLQYINSIRDDICTDQNELVEIYYLMVIENYARKKGDEKTVIATSNKLDGIIFRCLKSENCNSLLIKQVATILWRRFDNFCKVGVAASQILSTKKYFELLSKLESQLTVLKSFNLSLISDSNGVSCYPLRDSGLKLTIPNNGTAELQNLNLKLINHFKDTFGFSTVEVSKSKLCMIINCFTALVSCDNLVNADNQMSRIISLSDQFWYRPFELEKELALDSQTQKNLLPTILDGPIPPFVPRDQKFSLKSVLPAEWQVLTIDYVPSTDSLVLVRHNYKSDDPLFVSISLKRKDSQHSFPNILSSLKSIIAESDKTTSPEVTKNIKSYEEKLRWWELRKALDKKLEDLLSLIDAEWFGGFNSLFQLSTASSEDVKHFKHSLVQLIAEKSRLKGIDDALIQKNLLDIHGEIYELFLNIDRINVEKVANLLHFLLGKIELEDAFRFDDDAILSVARQTKAMIVGLEKNRISNSDVAFHTVLVPGASCIQIPWESIPSLRAKSVTRMPTLFQLKDHLIKYKNLLDNGIDACKGYYVINPGGDLQRTEANLSPKFRHLDGWNGLVGEVPDDSNILKAFDEKNLYIYAGHGGGEQYIKSKNIKKRDFIPPSLLLGCSSGLLKGGGSIHPYGTAYNYINGGCPMLLVNMWDVTDKDIDLFTISALTKWGFFVDYDSFDPFDISVNNSTISLSVAEARNVCKLKYLNGAAPIIYGLPLRLETI